MEFSSTQLMLGWLLLIAFTCAVIFMIRFIVKQGTYAARTNSGTPAGTKTRLSERTKYRGANTSRFSGIIALIGFAVSLAFSLLTISWVQYEKPLYVTSDEVWNKDEITEIPRIKFPSKPKPPVLVAPDKIAEPEPILPLEPVNEPVASPIENPLASQDSTVSSEPGNFVIPVPPPLLREPESDAPFLRVEQMPRFPGCETLEGTNAEKYACAERRLLEYIYARVKYPAIASENEIQGKVTVKFIVEKDGRISDAHIIRDIGGGCGEEVLRVVNGMNAMAERWTPGKQQGRPVRVVFSLPVSFRLK